MNKQIIFSGLFALFCFLILAPRNGYTQNSNPPLWVDNPAEKYSEERFLLAVGSAPSRGGARSRAQANIAKIFVSKVEVDESYVQEFEETTDASGTTTTEENTQLVTQSDVQSNQQIKNIQIKEVHEAENGTFYALAAINRTETARLYLNEINNNVDRINSLRKNADETDSQLEQLVYMKQAMITARMNKMLVNQRAILTGQPMQLKENKLSDITQQYRQAKQKCTVAFSHEDKVPRQVVSSIRRNLQNEGFTAVNKGEKPVVQININLMVEPVDLNRPDAEFMQWGLQVEAQNKENGKWFSTYMAEGREGSMNKEYARKRAIQAVQEKISSEFSAYINKELLSVK